MGRHAELVMRAKLGVQRAAQLVQETESRLAKVCTRKEEEEGPK